MVFRRKQKDEPLSAPAEPSNVLDAIDRQRERGDALCFDDYREAVHHGDAGKIALAAGRLNLSRERIKHDLDIVAKVAACREVLSHADEIRAEWRRTGALLDEAQKAWENEMKKLRDKRNEHTEAHHASGERHRKLATAQHDLEQLRRDNWKLLGLDEPVAEIEPEDPHRLGTHGHAYPPRLV